MEEYLEVKSYWGTARSEYITQGSDRLAVLLPGQRYTAQVPILYYPQNIAFESGYDTLAVEYGYQTSGKGFEFSEESLRSLFEETEEAVRQCLERKPYRELLFIGKSIGTRIQVYLKGRFAGYRQRHVFLTPIPDCIETIKTTECMVAVGTKDRYFKKEHIAEIEGLKNVKLLIIDGADHSLEKGGFEEDLGVMKELCRFIYGFINGEK